MGKSAATMVWSDSSRASPFDEGARQGAVMKPASLEEVSSGRGESFIANRCENQVIVYRSFICVINDI